MTTGYKYIVLDRSSYRVRFKIGIGKFAIYHTTDLKKAIRWRNEQLKKHGLMDRLKFDKSPDYFKPKKRHPIIGVYIGKATGRNWVAIAGPNEQKRSFSIHHYGNQKAFKLACRARYDYAGPLRVINAKAMPCKPGVPFILSEK
jgi:hypothetical protein